MLATLTREAFSREGWIFEPKLDGVRCLAFRRGGTTRLYSRNRKPLNGRFPELAEAFSRQRGDFIVDGEVVAFEGEVTSFARLQRRGQSSVPVFFYAFDLLYLDGRDARALALVDRKRLLADGSRSRTRFAS